MANPNIETYRGRRPHCQGCGKPLRAVYKTVTRDHMEEGKYKKVWLGAVDKNDEYMNGPDYDPYSNALPWPFHYEWDEEKGQYFRLMEVGRIKSRKFTGHFGVESCDLFCTKECAFRWAVRQLCAESL